MKLHQVVRTKQTWEPIKALALEPVNLHMPEKKEKHVNHNPTSPSPVVIAGFSNGHVTAPAGRVAGMQRRHPSLRYGSFLQPGPEKRCDTDTDGSCCSFPTERGTTNDMRLFDFNLDEGLPETRTCFMQATHDQGCFNVKNCTEQYNLRNEMYHVPSPCTPSLWANMICVLASNPWGPRPIMAPTKQNLVPEAPVEIRRPATTNPTSRPGAA